MIRTEQANHPATPKISSVTAPGTSVWCKRYAEKHCLARIHDFPSGITPPRRVRVYRRSQHFIIQWWDKKEKRTVSERIDGDLLAALSRARDVDERLEHFGVTGGKLRQCRPRELAERYLDDLGRRANATEIDIATVDRYDSAIQHFLRFVEQPGIAAKYRNVSQLDRDCQLAFAAYLNTVQISPNGHRNTRIRPLKATGFVMDVVRGMLAWAADPDRGNLLPDGFRNPFMLRKKSSNHVVVDPLCSPDITVGMAVDLAMAADSFQLPIFAPLLLYGLRPGELGWLFRENASDDWLRVACVADLDYTTKGRRDKRFPILDCHRNLWNIGGDPGSGLLFVNRRVAEGRACPPLYRESLAVLAGEYHRRCVEDVSLSAAKKRQLRNRLMKDAGHLNYDHVEAEFKKLSRALNWPSEATLKDLRHLFATCLENAGVPEFYRRYFLGQSLGRAPIVTYTHLTVDKLRQHYQKALETELAPLLDAIVFRFRELDTVTTKELKNA
jgi:hypothetical protein